MEMGEEREGGRQAGKEILYLSLHCHHQNDSCIKMDNDDGSFNVSLAVKDSHKTVCTDHNL